MKKIVYKYLSGFVFGIMMLVLCYLLTYTIAGEAVYLSELEVLHSPKSLLLQTIWSGILYVSIFITMINTHEFLKREDSDVTLQYLIMLMVHCMVIILVSVLSQKFGSFGTGVYSLLFGIGMAILILATVADIIQDVSKLMAAKKKVISLKEESK